MGSWKVGFLAEQPALLAWRALLYSVLDRMTELMAMSTEPAPTNLLLNMSPESVYDNVNHADSASGPCSYLTLPERTRPYSFCYDTTNLSAISTDSTAPQTLPYHATPEYELGTKDHTSSTQNRPSLLPRRTIHLLHPTLSSTTQRKPLTISTNPPPQILPFKAPKI